MHAMVGNPTIIFLLHNVYGRRQQMKILLDFSGKLIDLIGNNRMAEGMNVSYKVCRFYITPAAEFFDHIDKIVRPLNDHDKLQLPI